MLAMILAHAGGEDGTLFLLAFAPVGVILLIGFVIVLRPVVNSMGQPQPREEDLADRLLGEEEAQRVRSQNRRRRGIRRRVLRDHLHLSRRSGSVGSGVMMLPKSSSTTATRRVPGVVWVRTTTVSPGWTQLVASWLSGSPPFPQAVSATPSARQATRAGSARRRGRAAPGAGRACGRSIPKCSVRRECQDKSPDSAMLESGHPASAGPSNHQAPWRFRTTPKVFNRM